MIQVIAWEITFIEVTRIRVIDVRVLFAECGFTTAGECGYDLHDDLLLRDR
jgi:hypothetical protein